MSHVEASGGCVLGANLAGAISVGRQFMYSKTYLGNIFQFCFDYVLFKFVNTLCILWSVPCDVIQKLMFTTICKQVFFLILLIVCIHHARLT